MQTRNLNSSIYAFHNEVKSHRTLVTTGRGEKEERKRKEKKERKRALHVVLVQPPSPSPGEGEGGQKYSRQKTELWQEIKL
jgi:hypothetical protein